MDCCFAESTEKESGFAVVGNGNPFPERIFLCGHWHVGKHNKKKVSRENAKGRYTIKAAAMLEKSEFVKCSWPGICMSLYARGAFWI